MINQATLHFAVAGVMLLQCGCKKEKLPHPAPAPIVVPNLSIDGPASFFAVVEGTSIFFQDGSSEILNGTMSYNEQSSHISFSSNFYVWEPYESKAEVALTDQVFAGTSPSEEEFYAYFSPGSKPFGRHQDASPGIWININDPVLNQSSAVLVQPATSNFTITEVQHVDAGTSDPKVKVKAIFNCYVRHPNGGNLRAVTNGIFVGMFSRN